jgi:preprotein translocase subunit SecD
MQTYKAVLALFCVATLWPGCALLKRHDRVTLRIHEQTSAALPEGRTQPVHVPAANLTLRINPQPALSENDLQGAELVDTAGGKSVLLRFNAHGMFALEELTTRNRGRYLVVFLNGRPVSAWLVTQRISTGQFLLEGDFSDEEAAQLVVSLNKMGKHRR